MTNKMLTLLAGVCLLTLPTSQTSAQEVATLSNLDLQTTNMKLDITTVPFDRATAKDAAEALEKLFPRASFTANQSLNVLYIRATEDDLKRARDLIDQMEQMAAEAPRNSRAVISTKNFEWAKGQAKRFSKKKA